MMRLLDLPGSGLGPQELPEPDSRGAAGCYRCSPGTSTCPASSPARSPHRFFASNLAMSSYFWAWMATAALLTIAILLTCGSRSKIQIFLLRYTIHRQMF